MFVDSRRKHCWAFVATGCMLVLHLVTSWSCRSGYFATENGACCTQATPYSSVSKLHAGAYADIPIIASHSACLINLADPCATQAQVA